MSRPTVAITSVVVGPEEQQAALAVLRSGHLVQGPVVASMERAFAELCGVPHAVAVSNGTLALVAALSALGLGPGDEVITTPLTFVATLNAVLESGATVRFADVRDDLTVDPAAVAGLVNERTRAILPVHLYGLPADMPALVEVAGAAALALVEDAAQAHGARVAGRPVGSFGTGCFSFYATKNIQCGEGGMITTADDALADRLRLLRNQGMRERYRYETAGHNWRLTDLQAALLGPQLDRLATATAARAANAARLSAELADLAGLRTPIVPEGRTHVWHQYTVRVGPEAPVTREALAKELDRAGIGYGVYYPRLVHDYDCYQGHPRIRVDPTPRAGQAAGEVLSLPVHQYLTGADLDRVISAVRGAFGG